MALASLSERVSAALAAASAADAAAVVGELLGRASHEAGAPELLQLVTRHRRARCFCRAAFARAALDASHASPLPLLTAWRLSAADALLFREEYLPSLDAHCTQSVEDLQRADACLAGLADELLSVSSQEALFVPVVAELVAAGYCSEARSLAAARVAGMVLEAASRRATADAHQRRLFLSAAAHARPRHCATRFLARQLSELLRRNVDAEEEEESSASSLTLLLTLLPPTDSLRLCVGAQRSRALRQLVALHPDVVPALVRRCDEATDGALAARDEACLMDSCATAQAGLPGALYGSWMGRLAERAGGPPGARGLGTLLNALTTSLPGDPPAALAAQARAVEELRRPQPSRAGEYVALAKRRRTHLLGAAGRRAEEAPTGAAAAAAAAAGGESPSEAEAQLLVRQYAAAPAAAVLPPALRQTLDQVRSGFRRKWWREALAPALTQPHSLPPDAACREALIRLLEAESLLERGAGDAFAQRVAAIRMGGPALAALHDACRWMGAPELRQGLPTRLAEAARTLAAAAATAYLQGGEGAGAQVVDMSLRAWQDLGGDATGSLRLGVVHLLAPCTWRTAFVTALAAWSAALQHALFARLRGALHGEGVDTLAALLSGSEPELDSMALLVVHMAALHERRGAKGAMTSLRWAGQPPGWLSGLLCPEALRSPRDIASAVRAACAYARAVPRAMPHWALTDALGEAGHVATVMPGCTPDAEAEATERHSAAIPAALMHRLGWLACALDEAAPDASTAPVACACAAALRELLRSPAGAAWRAAAGETPPEVARRMAAFRFQF